MKESSISYSQTLLALILSLIVMTTGCDNPASSDDGHGDDHTEPHGLELVMNGQSIVEYVDGEVSGQFNITEGQETALIRVEFLNEEGEHIHDEDLGDEYSLGWNIEDEQIVGIDQHEEDGKWSFHLVGKGTGTSGLQLRLLHSGHADFETPPADQPGAIKVQVEAKAKN